MVPTNRIFSTLKANNKQIKKGKHQWTCLSAIIIKFLVSIPDYALLFSATAWMASFFRQRNASLPWVVFERLSTVFKATSILLTLVARNTETFPLLYANKLSCQHWRQHKLTSLTRLSVPSFIALTGFSKAQQMVSQLDKTCQESCLHEKYCNQFIPLYFWIGTLNFLSIF